jgi:hypothetical protein
VKKLKGRREKIKEIHSVQREVWVGKGRKNAEKGKNTHFHSAYYYY